MFYFQLIEPPWYLNCLKRIKIIVENNTNLLIVIFEFSLAALEPGWVDVEIESQGRILLGFKRMLYYPNEKQTIEMVRFEEPSILEDFVRQILEEKFQLLRQKLRQRQAAQLVSHDKIKTTIKEKRKRE